MERALIIGGSGGIGGAIHRRLAGRGVAVTELSRSRQGIDITDEASIARHIGALAGPFDLVLVATGALVIGGAGPEKTIKAISSASLADQFALNATGPALILKHAMPLMPRDRRAIFAALSARVGSIGDNALGGWYSYRAAKAALNQLVHTAAIELARTHPRSIVVSLHPGTVETGLAPALRAGHPSVSPDEAASNLFEVLSRLTPADTGGFFDWKGERVPW